VLQLHETSYTVLCFYTHFIYSLFHNPFNTKDYAATDGGMVDKQRIWKDLCTELHETLNTSLKFCGKHTHIEPE